MHKATTINILSSLNVQTTTRSIHKTREAKDNRVRCRAKSAVCFWNSLAPPQLDSLLKVDYIAVVVSVDISKPQSITSNHSLCELLVSTIV